MGEVSARCALEVRLLAARPVPLDVVLTCRSTELLALVGPSGAGKTTVLRAIAGLLRPSAGLVAVDGETWFSSESGVFVPPQARRVGLVFQDYALFPHLSALDNVAIALGSGLEPDPRRKAKSLLARVRLEGLEERRPAELSGGERQRVALARALAREPRVLLLDEPFSAVDRGTRERLKRELRILRESLEIPIVLVTHDIDEALALADRLSVLDHGTTIASGAPDEVRSRPSSPAVARLMGHANVFDGLVEAAAGEGGPGRIRWRGTALVAGATGRFSKGERVTWLIGPENVALLKPGDRAGEAPENGIDGILTELLGSSDQMIAAVRVGEGSDALLQFRIAAREARRLGLAPGTPVTVSLLSDAIHLMAPER